MRGRLPLGVWEQTACRRGGLPPRGGVRNRPRSHPYERSQMAGKLAGKTVAFIAADGVEQVELTEPWKAVDHLDKGETFPVDHTAADADPDRYDALVMPGGVANPDFLRTREDAVGFVRSFFETGKPVAVICHGPWTLIDAGVVKGRTLTSWPSLETDLRNAGATWVDEEVHVDQGLVSSRKPDDLPAFCAKLVEELVEGRHEGQRQ